MKFNTAIAALMALVNDYYANGASRGDMKALILMLCPLRTPTSCEEMWEMMGFAARGREDGLPDGLARLRREQDRGRLRGDGRPGPGQAPGTVVVPMDSDQDGVIAAARPTRRWPGSWRVWTS